MQPATMQNRGSLIALSFAMTAMFLNGCGAPPGVNSGSFEATPPLESPTPEAWEITPSSRDPNSVSQLEASHPLYPLTGIEIVPDSSNYSDMVRKSGAFWLRLNGISWSQVEPSEGVRNWEGLSGWEAQLRMAADLNLKTILVVRGTPSWAQKAPGYACGPVTREKLKAFASFLTDLVSRLSVTPYSVKVWELGNEPDIDPSLVSPDSPYGCWGEEADPYYGGGDYAEMLKTAYPAIKAADPEALVLVGGLLLDCDPINPPEQRDCAPARFLEGILKNEGGDFFDGVSFHAFDYYTEPFQYANANWHSRWDTTGPVVIAKASYLHQLLGEYGYRDKILINTASGLLCGQTGEEPRCQTAEFDSTKASYVLQSNIAALSSGLQGNLWSSLTGQRGTGLVDEKGNPLLAYQAFSFVSTEINGAVFSRWIEEIPGVWGAEFMRDQKLVWMLWSLDGSSHSLKLPSSQASIYNGWGRLLGIQEVIDVTNTPIYIEWIR
jgi:hypothetical protein